jgi:ABC-type glycerol-3-phosphate transport system substrate-binding protein
MQLTTRSIAAVFVAATLTAAALAGCSSGTPASGTGSTAPSTGASSAPSAGTASTAPSTGATSLNIAYWDYGKGAEDGNKALADGFQTANPGVTITLTPIAGDNWGGYYANLATLIASGKKPDLAFTASEGIKFLAQNNLVVPINDYLNNDATAKALKDDIAPALLQSFGFKGNITALPNSWNDMVIYYNTKLFDAAGLPHPTADWTWANFKTTAKALTKDTNGDGKTDTYGFTWAGNEIFPGILPWVANAGGNLVNADVTDATADSAPVVKAVTYLEDLIKEGIAPAPAPMSDIFTRFQAGQVAMFGGGRWPSATFLPNGFTDFDIQLYPKGDTYQTVAGAAGYAILTSAVDRDLAWKFQKYTVSTQIQDSQIGTPTAPRDSIPTLRSTAEKTVAAGIPPKSGQLFYDSVDKHPALTPFPAPAKYSEYESTVLRHLQLIFAGETTVDPGLKALQTELSAVIKAN